jgi:hypothetical protein
MKGLIHSTATKANSNQEVIRHASYFGSPKAKILVQETAT